MTEPKRSLISFLLMALVPVGIRSCEMPFTRQCELISSSAFANFHKIWTVCVRGDIYRLKTSRNTTGHEQRGPRYAIVMQSDAVMRPTVVVVPTSTSTIADDTRVK